MEDETWSCPICGSEDQEFIDDEMCPECRAKQKPQGMLKQRLDEIIKSVEALKLDRRTLDNEITLQQAEMSAYERAIRELDSIDN